ncbi:MAG TPA: class I SAM-dependent methyltransferase [Gaiellaceae bacterium]|nr:class I SAM-dependent methyltransferase [Gaiellaceae bacterium]
MTFAVAAEAYDRFMGRYSGELGRELASRAGLRPAMRALDVGAGTGKLTGALAEIVGEENVAAVDPSEPFAETLRERFPHADVRRASAEDLPFPDEEFDAVLSQLVLNFVADPKRALAEMRRVARRGGVAAAAVWDYGEAMTMLTRFWEAAATIDADGAEALDERRTMRLSAEGGLAELWETTGLADVEGGAIVVSTSYESFDELWKPYLAGVGPAGAYAASLAPDAQEALRDEYRRRLGSPEGAFTLEARAWYAVGTT